MSRIRIQHLAENTVTLESVLEQLGAELTFYETFGHVWRVRLRPSVWYRASDGDIQELYLEPGVSLADAQARVCMRMVGKELRAGGVFNRKVCDLRAAMVVMDLQIVTARSISP